MTHRRWISLLFLATGAWGQAAKPAAPPAPPKAATASSAAPTAAAAVAPGAAVITIPGLCDKASTDKASTDKASTDKAKTPDCKTVVTRAEFEQLVGAVAPTIEPPAERQLASQYGMALVMVHKAHEMGLDRGPRFQELMKVARIGVLTKELSQNLQDQAAKVSDKEVDTYYHNNEASFQEIDLQRIFIPRSKDAAESKEKPEGDAAKDAAKKEQQESEDAMKKLAEGLRTRAAAGEDFEKLQAEAVAASGFKGKPPTKLGKVRRTSLPEDQGQLFDLKPGETSQLITIPNGYLIYKAGEKDTLSLDKVRQEVFTTLASQRMQDAMQTIQQSATPELNPKYFPDTPAGGPPGSGQGDAADKPATQFPASGPK